MDSRYLQDIAFYQSELANQNVSAEQVVNAFLANIEKHQSLNGVVESYAEEAQQKAKQIDAKLAQGERVGKLAGVVFTIKDLLVYKDHRAEGSSNILKGFKSLYTATVVERLLAEDAIVIGRTNCDEFGMGGSNENSAHGIAKNPIDQTRVAGGSSGGSAVSVAAQMCHFSLGTDTGGSVRQPAAYCGISGFKPSYGTNSRYGVMAFSSSFDQVGVFTHRVADMPIIQNIIGGKDAQDGSSLESKTEFTTEGEPKKKIGYFKQIAEMEFDSEMKSNFFAKIEQLKAQGFEVTEIDFPYLDYLVSTYYTLTTAEASSNLSRYAGLLYGHSQQDAEGIDEVIAESRSEGFGAEVKRRILLGTFVLSSGYYDAYFGKAQKMRQFLKQKADEIFQQVDTLVMPTTPNPAFEIGSKTDNPVEMYLEDLFTVFAPIVGLPAISVPMGTDSKKLPQGFQIVGNYQQDNTVLQMADYCQREF